MYFGAGVIGPVHASPYDASRLECDILDYRPFERPVPFKSVTGEHLEPGGGVRGHYQPGVRAVSESIVDQILELAQLVEPLIATEVTGSTERKKTYASSELAKAVEAYSVDAAVREIALRFPDCNIKVMPHNNPGFDIRVDRAGIPIRYVEVKGTISGRPMFFLSEGERKHADEHPASLIVVADIELTAKTHRLLWHDGPIDERFGLSVVQWQGLFPEGYRDAGHP